jgi:uncharacterized protein YbaR (Trm112 family)
MRYLWRDKIDFEVLNPTVSTEWFVEPELSQADEQSFTTNGDQKNLRGVGLGALRKWYRLKKRRIADLSALLACPECHGPVQSVSDNLHCENCQTSYAGHPVPDFNNPVRLERKSRSQKTFA